MRLISLYGDSWGGVNVGGGGSVMMQCPLLHFCWLVWWLLLLDICGGVGDVVVVLLHIRWGNAVGAVSV